MPNILQLFNALILCQEILLKIKDIEIPKSFIMIYFLYFDHCHRMYLILFTSFPKINDFNEFQFRLKSLIFFLFVFCVHTEY